MWYYFKIYNLIHIYIFSVYRKIKMIKDRNLKKNNIVKNQRKKVILVWWKKNISINKKKLKRRYWCNNRFLLKHINFNKIHSKKKEYKHWHTYYSKNICFYSFSIVTKQKKKKRKSYTKSKNKKYLKMWIIDTQNIK